MVGLIRLGRRRLPDLSRYLFARRLARDGADGVAVLPGSDRDVRHHAGCVLAGRRPLHLQDGHALPEHARRGPAGCCSARRSPWCGGRSPSCAARCGRRRGCSTCSPLVGLVGFGVLCWYLYIIKPSGADPWLFRGGFFVCGIFTLMMIAAVTHQRSLAGPLLGNAVFLWIGTRSYGLYLYHWPIYQMMRRVAGRPLSVPQFLIGTAIACVVTELSYRLIETPVRKGHVGRWWRKLKAASDPLPEAPRRDHGGGARRRLRVRRRQPGDGRAAPERDRRSRCRRARGQRGSGGPDRVHDGPEYPAVDGVHDAGDGVDEAARRRRRRSPPWCP